MRQSKTQARIQNLVMVTNVYAAASEHTSMFNATLIITAEELAASQGFMLWSSRLDMCKALKGRVCKADFCTRCLNLSQSNVARPNELFILLLPVVVCASASDVKIANS